MARLAIEWHRTAAMRHWWRGRWRRHGRRRRWTPKTGDGRLGGEGNDHVRCSSPGIVWLMVRSPKVRDHRFNVFLVVRRQQALIGRLVVAVELTGGVECATEAQRQLRCSKTSIMPQPKQQASPRPAVPTPTDGACSKQAPGRSAPSEGAAPQLQAPLPAH